MFGSQKVATEVFKGAPHQGRTEAALKQGGLETCFCSVGKPNIKPHVHANQLPSESWIPLPRSKPSTPKRSHDATNSFPDGLFQRFGRPAAFNEQPPTSNRGCNHAQRLRGCSWCWVLYGFLQESMSDTCSNVPQMPHFFCVGADPESCWRRRSKTLNTCTAHVPPASARPAQLNSEPACEPEI